MPNTVIVGAQWGDEGKGKIIDVLTEEADMVVRYQGGNNAGHTVKIGDERYILHLVPSGILHAGKTCVIGNGVVVDPLSLVEEIDGLEAKGIRVDGRLFVSDRAHVVFPFHRALDARREANRTGKERIGTTKRGIGPAYGDKVSRVGLRIGDLLDPSFEALLDQRIEEANRVLEALGGARMDRDEILTAYRNAIPRMTPLIADTVAIVNEAVRAGRSLLLEGAQGTMLDIDFGTYPYVTSSNATAGGACTGAGIAPHRIDRVVGVVKAYTTRVGEGPFPTELHDETGRTLSREGNEVGATTGRPRRCGWFDAVVARYSATLNGVDGWAMTKLDVLDTIETLRICVAYELDGRRVETVPANIRLLERCRPVYEDMPGWLTPTSGIGALEDLPPRARAYVARLCELTGVSLGILSVGAARASTIRVGI